MLRINIYQAVSSQCISSNCSRSCCCCHSCSYLYCYAAHFLRNWATHVSRTYWSCSVSCRYISLCVRSARSIYVCMCVCVRWNTRLCVLALFLYLSIPRSISLTLCRPASLTLFCVSVGLISNKTPHFSCHSVSQMSLTSALRSIFGKTHNPNKIHPIPNHRHHQLQPHFAIESANHMEQALQLNRANKAPCKNDRKAFLQRVMLTRWDWESPINWLIALPKRSQLVYNRWPENQLNSCKAIDRATFFSFIIFLLLYLSIL